MDDLPTIEDVRAAADRIAGEAVRTPLVSSPVLDKLTGSRVFLKAENLQRTGSFKFRGAMNAIAARPAEAANGVVACSSGNHAQGIAEAAAIAGVAATIVMPSDAPPLKRARTERSGATVVLYERFSKTARPSPARSPSARARSSSTRSRTVRDRRPGHVRAGDRGGPRRDGPARGRRARLHGRRRLSRGHRARGVGRGAEHGDGRGRAGAFRRLRPLASRRRARGDRRGAPVAVRRDRDGAAGRTLLRA